MKKIVKILLSFVVIGLIIFILSTFPSIRNSFNRTLIDDNRYILILNGLKETLFISVLSIVIGSIFGIFICFLRMHKNSLIKFIGKSYISLVQGMPITVLLLIFYYVIFGSIDICPSYVAIFAFSIYFSGYVSEIYRGSLESINKGQIDSAVSLGFTKYQTYRLIIIPQMFSYIIPVYKNEVVSIIKLTSIVGFISVMDLTRASEIIRNRTYEAFFPLIFTALVYYLICFVVSLLLDLLYKKVNPRKVDNK